MPLFSAAARSSLDGKIGLAPNTLAAYEHFVSKLTNEFGHRLVCDISEQDIADLQRARVREGKSARTVNFEINTLRQILKKHGLWNALIGHVTHMHERKDVGKAIATEDEQKLIEAAKRSRPPRSCHSSCSRSTRGCARTKSEFCDIGTWRCAGETAQSSRVF